MARYLACAAWSALGALAILTPEAALEAPQRSVAVPNPSGEHALFFRSQYFFEAQTILETWEVLDLNTGEISNTGFTAPEVTEIVWLPGSDTGIIYLNNSNPNIAGGVTLWISDISKPGERTLVASLNAPFAGLKIAKTATGSLNFLVTSLAYPNGTAFNSAQVPATRHSGRLYEDIYPRHWDTWLTEQRYAVFGGSLSCNLSISHATLELRNLLQGINYTATRPESPVQPFGGSTDYDISPNGEMIALLSKASHLNKANYTASYIYLGPFDGSTVPVAINGPGSEAAAAGHEGASGKPTFSPDSTRLAFLQQDSDYYESDLWQMYVVDVASTGQDVAVSNYRHLAPSWDRWPDSISWALDSDSFFVTAEDSASTRIFNIPLSADESFKPENLTSTTTIVGFAVLPDSSLLVSSTSFWSTRDFYIKRANGTQDVLLSSTQADAQLTGLGPHTYSEIFFTGSAGNEQQIHALVVKPSNFIENETYPLAYIVHGGPQASHKNAWLRNWNYQLVADQGYIVVLPNPTGSTGYGQQLIDAIQGDWGGAPFRDLVLGWEYVKENLPYVDTKNGICAGASFGGFMTNWIQGQDFGRQFKSLVTHDGIHNTLASYATEELWFMRHDFNGTILDAGAEYDRWNPLNHVANWGTPQFVVHNTLDYRLPESDGLALFNILQTKGVPSRFLNFPDEDHIIVGTENLLFWYSEVFNWINHWSKGQPLDQEAIGK